jgi:hypothetical protein
LETFSGGHIPDGRAGRNIPTRHVLEAVLWILFGCAWHRHIELQNCARRFKLLPRDFASVLDVANEKTPWMKMLHPTLWRSEIDQRSAEKA